MVDYAPGMRTIIRDEEWMVKKIETNSLGNKALYCVGVSPLIKDREAIFLTDLEEIQIVNPAEVKLVPDHSARFRRSLLYLESQWRQKIPTDTNIHVGYKAAMDPMPYQLDPAKLSLQRPRQRILIADTVGLGKTLEAGILMSELIARGKGKRILVVTVKSMMTQFQKEMWNRFTIPLVRLDSNRIQKIRASLPSNYNPFFYYDKTIVSIDTLKRDVEYRTHLENAYWDIIVIDEAQNVADRGDHQAQRSRLAKLLADRSDTMIMLSATPHDGRAKSFASLMNMLDPTAIANPEEYTPEDIKGLCIRRFKKDVKDQVSGAFLERTVHLERCHASAREEYAYEIFSDMELQMDVGRERGSSHLFKTSLEKSLFSSPAACIKSIDARLAKLNKKYGFGDIKDIGKLESLRDALQRIKPEDFSRYQKLLELLKSPEYGWDSRATDDRLVIFTETLLATSNVALKYDDKIRSRREILAYAASNFAAALFGVCPVNGSVSRTGIADQYGVKSQVMSISAGITMLLILLFGTGFIQFLPVPVLTGIVISALIGTFEFELAFKLKKVDKAEHFIFYMVLLAVLFFGTVYGVLVGVLLSQVTFIIRQSIPSTAFLGVIRNMDGYHSLEGRMGKSVPIEGVVIYRFTGALFYANIDYFCEELENGIKEDTRVVIVDAGGMGSVDVSAAERLVILYHKLKNRGIAFYIAGHVSEVNDQLYNFGAGELISEGVVRSRIRLALQNAGVEEPYKLEQDYQPQQKPYAERFAEFSWAFGARAEEKMRELVHTIAEEIAREGLEDPAKIREKERQMARGYWSSADEVLFLTELELELALLREEGMLSQEQQDQMEEKILARDLHLEEKIRSRSEENAKRVARHVKKREKRFQEKHPDAYNGLVQERKRFRK